MGYPTIDAPYGYKPVNLIGGQVFSGSTREYPIAYNYGTSIFYGDPVVITSGFVNIATVPINTSNTTVGVFLGCSYTDPVTKQKRFSQYYPANTLAGDIEAVICDDPDTVFKIAVTTAAGATTIGSMSQLVVGVNAAGTTNVGSAATGNSLAGVVGATATTASRWSSPADWHGRFPVGASHRPVAVHGFVPDHCGYRVVCHFAGPDCYGFDRDGFRHSGVGSKPGSPGEDQLQRPSLLHRLRSNSKWQFHVPNY